MSIGLAGGTFEEEIYDGELAGESKSRHLRNQTGAHDMDTTEGRLGEDRTADEPRRAVLTCSH